MNKQQEVKSINIEIKGAVKKEGVYSFTPESIVNDAIKKAGGFLKTAYTSNINLSKHLKDEMVIYVYTKEEYEKINETVKEIIVEEKIVEKECVCEPIYIDTCIENKKSIIVPPENSDLTSNTDDLSKQDDKININTASKEQLTSLTGIGDAKAQNIISYRQEKGMFTSIEDIIKVSGISENIYAKIKDNICI